MDTISILQLRIRQRNTQCLILPTLCQINLQLSSVADSPLLCNSEVAQTSQGSYKLQFHWKFCTLSGLLNNKGSGARQQASFPLQHEHRQRFKWWHRIRFSYSQKNTWHEQNIRKDRGVVTYQLASKLYESHLDCSVCFETKPSCLAAANSISRADNFCCSLSKLGSIILALKTR